MPRRLKRAGTSQRHLKKMRNLALHSFNPVPMPPTVLVIVPLRPENHASICAAFNVITALDPPALEAALAITATRFARS